MNSTLPTTVKHTHTFTAQTAMKRRMKTTGSTSLNTKQVRMSRGKENQQRYPLQIRVYRHLHSSCRRTRPANHRTCLSWLNHSVIADLHSMDFWSGRQRMTVYMRMQSKKWVTVSFYGAPSPSSLPHNILSDPGVCEIIVGWEWGQRVLCACNR